MKLTIGIKALNEERHIAVSVASAVDAVSSVGGEVILADSGSTDRTVEIAGTFPINIIQLANPAEKSCGAGAQLAFQEAHGEYFYLLDGDMTLDKGFVAAGIAYLEAHPEVAGVGGRVREMNVDNPEFKIRAAATEGRAQWRAGEVDRLDCGGLYRSEAIRKAGYFADRNLHAFEEFELGARLRAAGWRLARIDHAAVDHFGHRAQGYSLLWRRVRSGYMGATGEVLRSSLGSKQLAFVLKDLSHIRIGVGVLVWWVFIVGLMGFTVAKPATGLVGLFAIVLGPLALLCWRRRSLELGVYSLASWNASALGLITGCLRKRISPRTPLAARHIHSSLAPPT